jgi:hypothetical protein
MVSMMQYLSLNTFDESYPHIPSTRQNPLLPREALRRLAWAVFYVDCMVDAGQHGVHTLDEDCFHLQLPGSDMAFLRGDASAQMQPTMSSSTVKPLEIGTQKSLSAHLIRTMAMRRRILHFQSSAKYSELLPQTLLERLDQIRAHLRHMIASLPSDLSYTEDHLFAHADCRTAFILLHVLRHNCFLMLHQVCLSLYKLEEASGLVNSAAEHTQRVQHCLEQRLKHAIPTAQIIQDALRLDVNCDPYVGSLGYTALEGEWSERDGL